LLNAAGLQPSGNLGSLQQTDVGVSSSSQPTHIGSHNAATRGYASGSVFNFIDFTSSYDTLSQHLGTNPHENCEVAPVPVPPPASSPPSPETSAASSDAPQSFPADLVARRVLANR